MKISAELSKADVETAILEYMQRVMSTRVNSVNLESVAPDCGSLTITADVGMPQEPANRRGNTRCGNCKGFGHNAASCTNVRTEEGDS